MLQMIQEMYAHHQWAQQQLWQCLSHLSDEQWHTPNDYSIGSVFAQVHHLSYWETFWFRAMQIGEHPDRSTIATINQLQSHDELKQFCDKASSLVDDVINALNDEWLEKSLGRNTHWQLLMQMYGHAMDHRAQVLRMLGDMGLPTFEQTYFFYQRDRSS